MTEEVTKLSFFVPGTPVPQGSKRIVRGRLIDANPNLKTWRETVAWHATAAAAGLHQPIAPPIAIDAGFYFPAPKSRRSKGVSWKTTTPDLDKLLRALFDALTAAEVITDDRHIVAVRSWKYETPDDTAGVQVSLRNIETI